MNRRSWSNLFVVLAAMSLMLGFWPDNPVKVVCWLVAPACLFLGAVARRRILRRSAHIAATFQRK